MKLRRIEIKILETLEASDVNNLFLNNGWKETLTKREIHCFLKNGNGVIVPQESKYSTFRCEIVSALKEYAKEMDMCILDLFLSLKKPTPPQAQNDSVE